MKYLLLIPILLIACAKEEITFEKRRMACYVSYKHTETNELLRIDTLWKDWVTGRWVDTIAVRIGKTDTLDFRGCPLPIPSMPLFRIEYGRYFFIPI